MSEIMIPAPEQGKYVPGGVRELLAIALPMVASQFCETLMMFTDRLFLSKLGPEQMSAAMGGGITCFMFMTFFMGLTGFAGALVAQHFGAKQPERCAVAVSQGIWVSLLATPLILLCIPVGHWIFELNKIVPAQLEPQIAYFDILMYGTVLGLLRNAIASFFTGLGRTKVVMMSGVTALLVNVGANYVLIYGHLGFPALGIRGAAIGTIIGSFAALVVLVCFYFRSQNRDEFDVVGALRYDRELMGKLLRFGTPSGLEFFLNIMAFNVLVLSFHSYGVTEAAAMTIMLNWEMLSFIPLIGVGIGVSSLVGRYMGAQDPDIAHRAAMSGMKVAALYTSVSFLVFTIFPTMMAQVFRPDGDAASFAAIAELATFMLRMVVIYLFADAMMIVFSGALRGAGDTFWTMVISVSGHWVFALTAVAMVRVFGVPPKTTWTVTVLLILLLGTSMYARYRSGKWRLLKVVDDLPAGAGAAALSVAAEGTAHEELELKL